MPPIDWTTIANVATCLEALVTFCLLIVAIVAAAYAYAELEHLRKAAKADLLLRLDAAFLEHRPTHLKLRGGEWKGGGPTSIEDWASVESYMGLFETIQILIDSKMTDFDDVDKRYGYRIANISNNPVIHRAKLVDERGSWELFVRLRDALKQRHPGWFDSTVTDPSQDLISDKESNNS